MSAHDEKHWVDSAAKEAFEEYFCRNYPDNTIIARSAWHVPKIFGAAMHAVGLDVNEPASEVARLRGSAAYVDTLRAQRNELLAVLKELVSADNDVDSARPDFRHQSRINRDRVLYVARGVIAERIK